MKDIIVIAGPTGVGKTKLSVELAKKLNGEIINADSTQVYKHLNIGTAKASKEEMDGVVHHLIDIKELNESYTVYDYQKDARNKIADIISRGKKVIVVGGTGLYLKALLYDYNFKEEEKEKVDYNIYTDKDLYNMLIKIDPDTEAHKNNRNRVIRALEYFNQNGMPITSSEKASEMIYKACLIGLTTNREYLYQRIDKRVETMIVGGLLNEVKDLYDRGFDEPIIHSVIGYRELYKFFNGEYTLEQAISEIKQVSRNYAKKQYTWFNNQMDVNWFNTNYKDFDKTISEVLEYISVN